VDRTKARIALNGEFSAQELEDVLRELASVRAGLHDAVPSTPPTEAGVLEQPNPLHIFRTLANGGVRIWLRHEGFGWIAFTLSAQERAGISEFLAKELGHTHSSH